MEDKKDQILSLFSREIQWANNEKRMLPKGCDSTEEAYFNGFILAMVRAKYTVMNEMQLVGEM